MAADPTDKSTIDQLVELFVYAPVGLVYDHEEVRERLVKRGRSQVQIARLMATMATKRAGGPEAVVGEVLGQAAQLMARGITEFGVAVGLAPDYERSADPTPTDVTAPTDTGVAAPTPTDAATAADPAAIALPIAGYDDLTAREIVALLPDLTADQRARIEDHERAGRGRKTVLAQIDRLRP